MRKTLAMMTWNKRSGLRPWAEDHPVLSIVIAVEAVVGIITISKWVGECVESFVEGFVDTPMPSTDYHGSVFSTSDIH